MGNEGQMPFTRESLERYLHHELGRDVSIRTISRLGEKDQEAKAFGYGRPLLLRVAEDGREEELVLHTLTGDPFDHQYASDRAGELCLAHHTFNKLPRHIRSLALGEVTADGRLVSLGSPQEFFQLTEYAPGRTYAHDLKQIAQTGELDDNDKDRVTALAKYLIQIHRASSEAPDVYQRRIREVVGDGEGIAGMLDTFPADTPGVRVDRLPEIERACVRWRWHVKSHTHRLREVHGDFHPWNVLFDETNGFTVLDRSRGRWGEPADDVCAMDVNYIFFSLRAWGCLCGAFDDLHRRFWDVYLSSTDDTEILTVAPLFYVWRALVLAHPWWYPDLAAETRGALFRFVEALLNGDRFDPSAVNDYLR